MNNLQDLQDLHDQVLPHDDQVGVPFHSSWSVGIDGALRLPCHAPGCPARAVVVARVGDGADGYCEACWRGGELARFLEDLDGLMRDRRSDTDRRDPPGGQPIIGRGES